jgi:hypothetical protein
MVAAKEWMALITFHGMEPIAAYHTAPFDMSPDAAEAAMSARLAQSLPGGYRFKFLRTYRQVEVLAAEPTAGVVTRDDDEPRGQILR